jgi:hypothetical protein
MLRLDYSAISPSKSQLSPFYRGKLAPKSAAASATEKHPHAPPGVRISIWGRHTKFS